ncbi:MAG: AAA domain-containing protein [Candidatus Gastranaerophilales bacterium]|nr:AAA domain-containing protein [Candidatus Gastranaerophilales bacterium]
MLQEATRAINSAFNNSFVKKLSLYLHDCVREEVKSSTFRNLKSDKDNKWIFLKEDDKLFTSDIDYLRLDGSDSKLTELMIQSELNQKEKYLIYGYMFLVGGNPKSRKKNEFLTPLLYMPCKLERNGVNINCMLTDEFLSLNTGALASLMKKNGDEEEMEQFLEGLLDVVPSLPITDEKMEIFLTTLKSVIPDVEIALDHSNDIDEDNISKETSSRADDNSDSDTVNDTDDEIAGKTSSKIEKITLTNQCAIILTKRPSVTAGVLHELTQIAEKSSGVYRETVLNVINEEYTQAKSVQIPQKNPEGFNPITPLALSDSQASVIENIETSKLVSVYGPPGTGKSQTIVNLVAHLIANGKTVLVASRMDKAVDVVADRLNELGAPFLALRAGRLNYQKQLSYQLQDLLSNKVDLDEDLENNVLVDVSDMEDLLNSIRELEQKAENIIKLEKEWTETGQEVAEKKKTTGLPQFIRGKFKRSDIELIRTLSEDLEKNLEKSGFFASVSNYTSINKLKKVLKIDNFELDRGNILKLNEELELADIICKANDIEEEIQSSGNIHVITEKIRTLKKKQKKLVTDILINKRREALKGLMRDQVKRQRLFVHSKSLVERKKSLQNRLLEAEDFKPLLEAFPCWCVTTYAVSGSLPMKPGLFDVAIIDEASQCDIASCFPILYRAKRAVIVGDDKQLPHLSFLEAAKEQSFMSKYEVADRYQLMWRFRTNSMFDIANYYSMRPVLLDEHFRSLPPIINFSNKEFYANRIRIMRQNNPNEKVLEIVNVPDGKVDFDVTRNLPEIEALVKRVHEIIVDNEKDNPDNPITIGIISPFRAQVEQLKISVGKVISDYMMEKHKIEIGTAHTFQGDERDVILISWAYANNSFPQSLTFLQKPNLFNVAITRAKNKLINFVSKDFYDLPEGLFRSYLSYIKEYDERHEKIVNNELDENVYKNSFEREVAETLRDIGYEVQAGVELGGVNADILVNNKFVIECDGLNDSIKSNLKDMKKLAIIERCGFKVCRFSYREWLKSSEACINRITNYL